MAALSAELDLRKHAVMRGDAKQVVTRLDATLDVGALPPGNYELALDDVRRTGG